MRRAVAGDHEISEIIADKGTGHAWDVLAQTNSGSNSNRVPAISRYLEKMLSKHSQSS